MRHMIIKRDIARFTLWLIHKRGKRTFSHCVIDEHIFDSQYLFTKE